MLPCLVAHPKVVDVARAQPKRRIGLRVDLEHAAEFVELLDIGGAEIGRERREHLIDRNVHGLRLGAIDIDAHLRRSGPEGGRHVLQRALRLRVADDGVGDALQLGEIRAAVAQLDLHGETAGIADALNRRRREQQDLRPSTASSACDSRGNSTSKSARLLQSFSTT